MAPAVSTSVVEPRLRMASMVHTVAVLGSAASVGMVMVVMGSSSVLPSVAGRHWLVLRRPWLLRRGGRLTVTGRRLTGRGSLTAGSRLDDGSVGVEQPEHFAAVVSGAELAVQVGAGGLFAESATLAGV